MGKIATFFLRHCFLSALLAGALSACVFAPFYQIWLLPLSFGAAFFLADHVRGLRKIGLTGYFFGFGFFGFGFYWIGNALLVDAATFGGLYPVALLSAGAFFGLFSILPFVFWALAGGKLWRRILVFASSWVLIEWVRSFIFTGFPWNLLGTALAFDPNLIQTAALWGTYGLSFVLLVWAGLFYAFMIKRSLLFGLMFILLPLALYGLGMVRVHCYDDTPSDLRVRLVQPSIAQQMKWSPQALKKNFETYLEMTKSEGLDDVDFVVWGETAVPFDLSDEEISFQIRKAVPKKGYLITGALRFSKEKKFYNSLFVLDSEGKIVAIADKYHLVPFGEYIPFRRYLPSSLRPIAHQVTDFGQGEKFRTIKLSKYPAFGALICYEIIFPDEVVDRAQKPSWLVVLSNDGWYGNSAGPYQHLAATQMRAVEEGVVIVRSANNGISALIDPLGRIKARIDYDVVDVLDVNLPQKMILNTFYQGSFVVIIMLLVLICCLAWDKMNVNTKNS